MSHPDPGTKTGGAKCPTYKEAGQKRAANYPASFRFFFQKQVSQWTSKGDGGKGQPEAVGPLTLGCVRSSYVSWMGNEKVTWSDLFRKWSCRDR